LLLLAVHGLKHTTLEMFELIIIEVYGSTVFGVVGFIIVNDCFLLTDGIVIQTRYEDSIHGK